jgi:hypothetical protein
MVKTGFCQRDLGQTNEQQRHFNEQPISELDWKVDLIPTSLKLPCHTVQQASNADFLKIGENVAEMSPVWKAGFSQLYLNNS